jgi:nucleoside-diphosphate kinase
MPHPKKERTLVIIKPDAIQRTLVGEIVTRYERVGLKLVALKMMVPTAELIEKHYTLDPEWRRVTGEKTIKGYKDKGLVPPTEDPYEVTGILLGRLVKYMTSGPIIAMVWEGAHALFGKLPGEPNHSLPTWVLSGGIMSLIRIK